MKTRALLFVLTLAAACDGPSVPPPPSGDALLDVRLRTEMGNWGVAPIGPNDAQAPALVDLGRSLFFDKILSGNRDVSCATCHDLTLGAIDGLSLAVGTGGAGVGAQRVPGLGRGFVPRNAPSLLNMGLGFYTVLWDGRVRRSGLTTFSGPVGVVLPAGLTNILAAQAMLPVLSRVEMRGNAGDTDVLGTANELAVSSDSVAGVWAKVMQRLLGIQEYTAKFAAAYPSIPPGSLGFQHAANAIAAFEISAFTKHDSPFDRYMALDFQALTDDEKRGGIIFFGKGQCASCHSGAQMGGNSFINIGIPQLGPGTAKSAPLDKGHAEAIAGSFSGGFYDFAFRAPPLRNVELSAPYMHNGAYPTLDAVLRHYSNPDSALRNYDVSQLRPDLRASLHSEPATITAVLKNLDFRVKVGIKLTEDERKLVVGFLKALTDPAARNLASLIPAQVPSGLPVP